MTATEIIVRARAAGVTLYAAGDKLKYAGPLDAVRPLLPLLAERKTELLAALRRPDPATLENIEERAAILEHDACQSAEDAERQAVQLVQCRRCRHFTAGAVNPLAGVGRCVLNAWPQSSSTALSPRPWPPYPGAPRYCDRYEPLH